MVELAGQGVEMLCVGVELEAHCRKETRARSSGLKVPFSHHSTLEYPLV